MTTDLDNLKQFKRALNAKSFDLDKFGWSEYRDDGGRFAYLRKYFKQNYHLTISHPFEMTCFIDDILQDSEDRLKQARTQTAQEIFKELDEHIERRCKFTPNMYRQIKQKYLGTLEAKIKKIPDCNGINDYIFPKTKVKK